MIDASAAVVVVADLEESAIVGYAQASGDPAVHTGLRSRPAGPDADTGEEWSFGITSGRDGGALTEVLTWPAQVRGDRSSNRRARSVRCFG